MKNLIMILAFSAVSLSCYATPDFRLEGFTPAEEKPTITLKEDRMLVRLDGSPALLFGPFKAQGPYPVVNVNGLIEYIRRTIIVFYMRDNLYAGDTNPERYPDKKAVFLSDGAGNKYYCASAILTGKKKTPCAKFIDPQKVSFKAAEKPFNGFRAEPDKPISVLNMNRIRVKINGRTNLLFGPMQIDGPYDYTVPGVWPNRVLLAKNRAYITDTPFDGFADNKVFFIKDSNGVNIVCGGATLPKADAEFTPECHHISED